MYFSNLTQEEFLFVDVFPPGPMQQFSSKCLCKNLPSIQVEKSPHFSCTEFFDCLTLFPFYDQALKRTMLLLLSLDTASFCQISRSRVKCFFHYFVKHPIIPEVDSKQYKHANMFGVINAFDTLQDYQLKMITLLYFHFRACTPLIST